MPKPVAKPKNLIVSENGREFSEKLIPTKVKGKPVLTNRGGAGLNTKLTPAIKKGLSAEPVGERAQLIEAVAKHRIAPALQDLVISMDQLHLDPENARVHPERNLEAIRQSLRQYGQVKPIVVRKETMTIVAGNGTYEAAKLEGWTEIAASMVDMNLAEAAGYGLADNRTAELAKWDFEIVARLDKLIAESGQAMVGWTMDELEVLRAADWVPPPLSEGSNGEAGEKEDCLLVSFNPEQFETVGRAITMMRMELNDPNLDQADVLTNICAAWLGDQNAETSEEDIPF